MITIWTRAPLFSLILQYFLGFTFTKVLIDNFLIRNSRIVENNFAFLYMCCVMKKKGELTDRTNQAAFEAVCEIPLQTNIGRLKSLGNIAYSQDLRRSGGNVVARSANEIPSWVEAAAEILTY